MPKIKNIIIFIAVGTIFVLIYIFFIKKTPDDNANLISSSGAPAVINTTAGNTATDTQTQNFLSLLLNIQEIKLDASIFVDPAFTSLDGSHSITLTPDGTEGRANPFAPIVADVVASTVVTPTCTVPKILDTVTNTCITPPPSCVLPKVLNPTTNTCVTPAICTPPKVLSPLTNTCVNSSPL